MKNSNFIAHKSTKKIHIFKRGAINMKRRIKKDFAFQYPLTQKVVRNCKLVTDHIGNLLVEGTGYFNTTANVFDNDNSRYDADIDFVKWNGTDIKPVLEVTGLMDTIAEAAIRYVSTIFESGTLKEVAA